MSNIRSNVISSGKIDRRQYVLTNDETTKYKDFIKIRIEDYFLIYNKELRIVKETDKNGCEWYILGEAYSVDEEHKQPSQDIRNSSSSDVSKKYFYWTGRWMLIGNHELYSDATGMMSQYYFNANNGYWYVSPSLHVMYEINKEHFPGFIQQMTPNLSINWHPAPLTKLEGVCRLFPTQFLKIEDTKVKPYYREVISEEYQSKTNKQKQDLLSLYLINAAKNIEEYSGRSIWMALTAGIDSRTVISVIKKTGVKYSAYTFDHDNISKADRIIPEKMAKDFGLDYKFIKSSRRPLKEWLNMYDEHSFYSIGDADRVFFACGQYNELPDNAITIKSVFEICRGFYNHRIPECKDIYEAKKYYQELYPEAMTYSNYAESIEMWFEWCIEHPNKMDIRDRFYMEERVGGWISNLQQSLDILPIVQINLANSAAIMSAAYWYSCDDKASDRIYYEQIKVLCPEALLYPINPPERFLAFKGYLKNGLRHPVVVGKKIIYRLLRKIKHKLRKKV